MEDLVPAGASKIWGKKRYKAHYFKALVEGAVLDAVVARVKPDIIIILSYYGAEALAIKYRYCLPVILVTAHFRRFSKRQMAADMVGRLMEMSVGISEFIELLNNSEVRLQSFKDLQDLYLKLPEVALMPSRRNPHADEFMVCLAGSGIDYERKEERLDIDFDERPLIFCSLGSQNSLKPEVGQRFYQQLIQLMSKRSDWRAVISVGKRASLSAFQIPPNVVLTNWAPQLQMLSRCTVMVNHGGWGAVKECIAFGVPMLALPLMRDHFDCADQVCRLGIGLKGNIQSVTSDDLGNSLTALIHDAGIRERMTTLQAEIKQEDSEERGIRFIESLLSSKND